MIARAAGLRPSSCSWWPGASTRGRSFTRGRALSTSPRANPPLRNPGEFFAVSLR